MDDEIHSEGGRGAPGTDALAAFGGDIDTFGACPRHHRFGGRL